MDSSNRDACLPAPSAPVVFRHGLGNTVEMIRAALGYVGAAADPMRLAGSSGVAFRVHWPVRRIENERLVPCWDATTAAVCPFDPYTSACEPFGWRILSYRNVEESVAWQFAIQSLSRGRPVLSYGFVGEPEDVLLTGYRLDPDERAFYVLTRHAGNPIRARLNRGSWPGIDDRGHCVGILDALRPDRRLAQQDALHRALRRSIWIAQNEVVRGERRFLSGSRAYGAWIDHLLTPATDTSALSAAETLAESYALALPGDEQEASGIGIRHVLHRTLTALCDARQWAIRFLETAKPAFDTDKATACFAEEERALCEARGFWPPVVMGGVTGHALVATPEGFERSLRLEETARCLRVASQAYQQAIAEIDRNVPPVEQELLDPDADDQP